MFHTEHMAGLTCVQGLMHLCSQHIKVCVSIYIIYNTHINVCVCVWPCQLSRSDFLFLWLKSVLRHVYVCEFMQVNNRVWNVCFPHWAEHFLMQYVKTCVIPHQRGRKYRRVAGPLAIGPLVLAKLGPVGGSFVNQLEAWDRWEKQRQHWKELDW